MLLVSDEAFSSSSSPFRGVDEAAAATGATDDDADKEKIGNRTKEIYRLTRNNINTRKDASEADWRIDAIRGDDGRNYALPKLAAPCLALLLTAHQKKSY